MLSTTNPQVASFLRWMAEQRDEEAKRIGRLIAQLRETRGWSQQDLAHELHMSVTTISRWERGLHKGYAGNVRKLAAALEVEPSVLLPKDPLIESQLNRIETELNRQGALLDTLLEVLEGQLGDRAAAAAKRAQQQELGSSRATRRRARA